MPSVTGNLSDVGLGHLVGLNPEISFTLNEPNTAGAKIFATRPEKVTPASNGDFTATLADTTVMSRDAWYEMHVRWNEPGSVTGQGFSPVDVHTNLKIRVPASGGVIGDLILGGITNLSLVYVSLTAPVFKLPFMLWLKTDPDDPNNINGLNTGILYRWENS